MLCKLGRALCDFLFIIYSCPGFHLKHVRVYYPLNTVTLVGFASDTGKDKRFDQVFQTSEKSIQRSLTAVEFHCLIAVVVLYFTRMFTTNQLSKSQCYVSEAWSHLSESSLANKRIVACRSRQFSRYQLGYQHRLSTVCFL